jgi:hypothetical protein
MTAQPRIADIAKWMLSQVQSAGMLYQDDAAYQIGAKFGEEYTYTNENGNLAIRRDVLHAFREISEADVVWERGGRLWRRRETYDNPGRRQD